jgi:hypothetical protein
MSGVDTAYAAGFVDSDVAQVNSPPFFEVARRETVGKVAISTEEEAR